MTPNQHLNINYSISPCLSTWMAAPEPALQSFGFQRVNHHPIHLYFQLFQQISGPFYSWRLPYLGAVTRMMVSIEKCFLVLSQGEDDSMVLRRLVPVSGIIPVRYHERVFADLRTWTEYEQMIDGKPTIPSKSLPTTANVKAVLSIRYRKYKM